jgi:predicted Zn-dependent peptidase
MSSRLFQNVREKHGLAYSVYSFSEFLSDTGIFGVYAGTDNHKIHKSIELILQEFKKLRKELIKKDELAMIKSQLKGNLMLGLESPSSRMNRLAKMEAYLNEFFTLDDVIKDINAVTSKKVMEVAELLFDESKLTTTILRGK